MDSPAILEAALPGYEVGMELGRGAYGVVVSGRHRQLGREVAIKQLAPGLVENELVRARFLSEAQVLASIEHPHIVPIYDYVEHDEVCALVMERLGGGTVWKRFVDGGFDQRTACAIALVVCSALHDAHGHGVLHRDMKPENVLFGADRVLKVTDFGIARVVGADDTLATREGELLGTPAYMAPEQASGADLGPATDVYATGVMLYELLSGQLPYDESGGSLAIVMRHINEDARPLEEVAPTVPPRVRTAVMGALVRDPAGRFASAEQFGVAVAEAAAASWGPGWLEGLSVALREPGPILAGAQKSVATLTATAAHGDGSEYVRPSIELHTGAGAPQGLVIRDLMPLRSAPVEMPAFPKALTWIGAVLAVLSVVLGLAGVGSSAPSPVLPAGSVSVAGHDPAAGAVSFDLARPVTVVVRNLPTGSPVPSSAHLVLSLGGLAIVHSTSIPFVRQGDSLVTTLDASAGRYVVGGRLSAELDLIGSGGSLHDDFAVDASRSPFASLGGAFVIVAVLIIAAYAESLSRALRRGRRRDNRAAVSGLVVVGAVGGAAAALLGWLFGIDAPTLTGLVVPAVLGALAGASCGFAAYRVGRRARARRQSNRLVLVARRSPSGTLGPQAVAGGG